MPGHADLLSKKTAQAYTTPFRPSFTGRRAAAAHAPASASFRKLLRIHHKLTGNQLALRISVTTGSETKVWQRNGRSANRLSRSITWPTMLFGRRGAGGEADGERVRAGSQPLEWRSSADRASTARRPGGGGSRRADTRHSGSAMWNVGTPLGADAGQVAGVAAVVAADDEHQVERLARRAAQ